MKTNTNSYTIIYSVVLVVVVALMLASVYQALKPQQDANVMLDTQKQILYALNQDRDMTNEEAAKLWQNLVEADDMIDANGNVVEAGKQGGTEAGFQHLNSAEAKDGKLVVFRCKVDGETKYVIPVYGNGLWGPISGFIAVNGDKTTVFGAYFNHEGETAGLGAEIKDRQEVAGPVQGQGALRQRRPRPRRSLRGEEGHRPQDAGGLRDGCHHHLQRCGRHAQSRERRPAALC